MFYAIKRDGLIYMPGRDMSYFPKNIHSLVVSEENLLNSGKDRLLQIYNRNAEMPVKDFADDETARDAMQKLLTNFSLESIPMAKRNKNQNTDENTNQNGAEGAGTTPTDGGGEAKERASRTPKNAIIRLKTDKNPKREGSAAHKRFALYADGQTVEDFLKAGGTMGDINFDQGKGFIALEGVDAPAGDAGIEAATE